MWEDCIHLGHYMLLDRRLLFTFLYFALERKTVPGAPGQIGSKEWKAYEFKLGIMGRKRIYPKGMVDLEETTSTGRRSHVD